MKIVLRIIALGTLLLGLPLAGVWMAGHELAPYLEFPPRTLYVEHAPFSWPVFIGLALVILAVMVPFLVRIVRRNIDKRTGGADAVCPDGGASVPPHEQYSFPWWGWLSVGLGLVCWILAWTRLEWMESLQRYTFTPQWICYIVAINALTFRRKGRCLLTHQPRFFLLLFPLSAAFWWFFEYLNRFVQNWWYTCGAELSPLQYFIAATLPFSTVLPAVLSSEEWLAGKPETTAGLENFIPIRVKNPKAMAWLTLIISGAGLLLIGRYPDLLFPLLWVAPLLLLIAFQTIQDGPSFFPEVRTGDWRRIYRLCLAALICGFFWELWNWHSLAKWIYSVPYVDRFHLFEMPILGYSGYLPFGLECAAIAHFLKNQDSPGE